jgi:hypothetical protein
MCGVPFAYSAFAASTPRASLFSPRIGRGPRYRQAVALLVQCDENHGSFLAITWHRLGKNLSADAAAQASEAWSRSEA